MMELHTDSSAPPDVAAVSGSRGVAHAIRTARADRRVDRTTAAGRPTILIAAVVLLGPGATVLQAQEAQEPPPAATAQPPAPVILRSVQVRGADRLTEAAVRGTTGLAAGDTIDYRDIQDAIRRLWSTGQFRDVQVAARETGDDPTAPVVLVVEVVERPYVASVEFRGLEHVDGGTIRDTVGLNGGGPLRLSSVSEAEAMVRELLADEGIRLRSIEHRLEPIEGRPDENRLIFNVEEGHRVAVADIEFIGNEVFQDNQLREAMNTKEEGFLWFRSGTLDDDRLRTDLRQSLPSFYGAHGYLDFQVVDDSVAVDPVTGKARLVVEVHEGEQYRLADFEVQGNRRFPAEQLTAYFGADQGGLLSRIGFGGDDGGAVEGSVFDRAAFQAATQRVRDLYRNNGYLLAQVEPVIEPVPGENGQPAVRVGWNIQEGRQAYINRVDIVGNTYTHESVIRNQLYVLPGQVYNEEAIIQSMRSIMALGFFETPLPNPKIQPTDDGNINITFVVKEKQTGSVNFGTAVGGGTGIAGFLGYDQPNLFGQAKSGHLRWEYGQWASSFEASYRDPAILNSLVSGSISLFRTGNRYYRFNGGDYRRTGGAIRFGLPLPTPDRQTRLILGYSLSRTNYEQFDSGSALFGLPASLQSTATIGVARSTLNHPLFPTAGTRQEIEANFSGGILGGDGDFQKYTASGSWYVPAGQLGGDAPDSRPIRFTLGLTAEVGALFGDASRFPFDRFWMGGVQFGRPLRGYEETSITPFGYFGENDSGISLRERLGNAYLRLSAEYAMRLNDNISLSLFYDAGNVWREPTDINPTQLFRGAGIGLTLVTPFGPLGLDYAYGFDKTDPGWQLHFKFGPAF